MAPLPPNPHLDQLRRQARDLERAAQRGDPAALDRVRAVADRVTLSAAQLAVAREHGFASWLALKTAVEARSRAFADAVDAFCTESVRGRIEQARRLLDATPEIALHALPAALVLGDVERVQAALARDGALVSRVDPRTGWTALHAVCASRWHVEPVRAAGLVELARILLAAGADVSVRSGQWTPLRCAIASAQAGSANTPLVATLLEHGAPVEDHDLYLAGFAADAPGLLAVLVARLGDVAPVAEQALAAPISAHDEASLRLLLGAGADPKRYRDDDGRPASALAAAIAAGVPLPMLEALLAHGADASEPAPDGRTPLGLATARGRDDICALLRDHGADDAPESVDLLRRACLRGDEVAARRQLAAEPRLLERLADSDALPHAAETGNADAVRLILDLGVAPDRPRAEHGATALHAAAYAGSVDAVRLLVARGAALDARDTTWQAAPLEWALVGSGERPTAAPAPDWVAVVGTLLDAGASTEEITLSADDPKPPSAEVARLLRERIGADVDAGERSDDPAV